MEKNMPNKEQKSAIRDVINEIVRSRDEVKVSNAAIKVQVEAQLGELENMKEDYENQYEEMSEKTQEGESGQALNSLVDELDTAIELANTLVEELDKNLFEELTDHLESVIK
jgi:flagellar biosynthesis chaperone FliJ